MGHLFTTAEPRTSGMMSGPIFDMQLRAGRRDRASRQGPALFLHERAFEDILERLQFVQRSWRSILLLGCPNPAWPGHLADLGSAVTVFDPGPLFAASAGGRVIIEDAERLGDAEFDLCIAIGTLDSVNDVALAFRNIWAALQPDSLLIGAVSGGETLPRLRSALRAADALTGEASPHVHPRFDGPGLCAVMTAAGFTNPVVDVDRVSVRYRSLQAEISDLRAMAATNVLARRSRRPFSRAALAAASAEYSIEAQPDGLVERFDLLHFAGWTPGT